MGHTNTEHLAATIKKDYVIESEIFCSYSCGGSNSEPSLLVYQTRAFTIFLAISASTTKIYICERTHVACKMIHIKVSSLNV